MLACVEDRVAAKGWVRALPSGPPDKSSLARIVGAAGGSDEAENSYHEAAVDPAFVQLDTARRRFRGQYLRRLRRLNSRERRDSP